MQPHPAQRVPRWFLVTVVAGVVVVAAVSAAILTLPAPASQGAFALPAGTLVYLKPTTQGYVASYGFSWGWGGYLEGSWRATANTTVFVRPYINCFHCPLMRIFSMSGTSGTFNLTFGGTGWEYPNMTLSFSSASHDVVEVLRTIQVVYPPLTVLYPAGTVLNGTGFRIRSFDVHSPGAFLVGAWTAVNTTLWSYEGTPQEETNCGSWPPYAPPQVYDDSFTAYLMPGPHAVGVMQCSTRPWTVTVTVTIGIFYS